MSADPKFEIIKSHLDADTDSGITAIHHTLGHNAFQASPGSHRHDGTDSHKIKMSDVDVSMSSVAYQPEGGTLGTQPTFSGPAITGSYVRMGVLVHFRIDVEFDNIISFGTGQYYLTLPFPVKYNYFFRDGCLHDISAAKEYAMGGHVAAGAAQMLLRTTASNGIDVPFEHNVPITLAATDNFHVSGTYEIQV
jgi:hypothetical protein